MHIYLLGQFCLSFLSNALSENQCSKDTFLLKLVMQNLRYFWLFITQACKNVYQIMYFLVKLKYLNIIG